MIVKNKVTRVDGSVVNISVDFSKEAGTLDSNGHRLFTNQQEIDNFIDGIEFEPIVSNSNTLEDEASKLLND